jgi:Putative phage serine protease XkdF
MAERSVKLGIQVVRKSDELGIIWGWASVADIVDLEGDVIPQDVLAAAVYQFMEDYYSQAATIKENHGEDAPAVLVESTLEFKGMNLRWWVGVKLMSEELREAARDGKISGFSIGGIAQVED